MIIIEFHNAIIYVKFSPPATKAKKKRSIFRFSIEFLLCNLKKAGREAPKKHKVFIHFPTFATLNEFMSSKHSNKMIMVQ